MSVIANLVEVHEVNRDPIGTKITVDFNPQSLKLTHSPMGSGATQGTKKAGTETTAVAGQSFGYSTSLTMELLFDSSRDGSDVRARTLALVALTRAKDSDSKVFPTVRFSWGSFLFTGCIESLGESIDLFSAAGVPLRATVSLSMRGVAERDKRPASEGGAGASFGASAGVSAGASLGVSAGASFGASAGVSAGASASFGASASAGASAAFSASASFLASASASAAVGTTPLTVVAAGDTVQSLAARAGVSWRAVAAANGIDNPRLVPPGTVLDLRVGP